MFDAFHRIISKRSRSLEGNKLRAVVVNIKDPMGLGRIQCRARDIHDQIPDDQLPWCSPNEGFGSGIAGVGKQAATVVGAIVHLMHLDNSPYHPAWEHGPATTDKKIPDLNESTPGEVDQAGNLFNKIFGDDNSQNIINSTHQTGTGQSIATDGSVALNSIKDFIHQIFGQNAMMKGDDQTTLTLNFKNIIIKADSLIMPMATPGGGYEKDVTQPAARSKPSFTAPSGTTY